MRTRAMLIPALLTGLLVTLLGCSGEQQQEFTPPDVTVAHPAVETVPPDDEMFTGRTDAKPSNDIKARVTGYLDKILFKDGDEVKKDDPLFEIDPRPYKALLDRANGEVTRAQARVTRLDLDVKRAEKGITTGAVTREDYDKTLGDKAEAEAALKAARANVEAYKLDVEFCSIKAPISGRISRASIDPGNLVKADDTLLTNIANVDPIPANFDIDEATMLRLQRMVREGQFKAGGKEIIPVFLGTSEETGTPHKGTLEFLDNRVDSKTGTLRARATFPNPKVNAKGEEDPKGDRVLSPGLFVRIRVPIGQPYKATLVAERALMSDQGQRFVYVVKDGKAERRLVDVGTNKDGLRVILPPVKKDDGTIAKGLEPTDLVIVNNIQRVRVGKPVRHESPAPMASMTAPTKTNP